MWTNILKEKIENKDVLVWFLENIFFCYSNQFMFKFVLVLEELKIEKVWDEK